ncbi:hypothetical protein LTR51_007924 [Lithohypha guttulata]|nr:hypothetical protein LTR51_007924 [Lithohypha guttulata]
MADEKKHVAQQEPEEEEFDDWIGEYARKRRAFFSFPNDFRFVAKFDQMEAFRECWKRHGNEQRTGSKDA